MGIAYKKVLLKTLIEQIRGVSYNKTDLATILKPTHITVLRANNIKNGKLKFEGLIFINRSKIRENQVIREGDIIVAASSGSISIVGKAAQSDKDLDVSFGAFCKLIRPKANSNSGYIGYYFQSPYYRHTISRLANGANINNIRNEHIDNLEIPLPPLQTQKKIVEVLDKAQALIDARKEQIKLMDELIQAVFYDMFGDPVSNPMGWEVRKLSQFLKIDTIMVTDFEYYADYPHIGISNIEKNTGKLSNFNTVKEDKIVSGKYLFAPEHIIYSKIRPNLNKVALPAFHGLCSADSYPLLVDRVKAHRTYVALILRSEYFLNKILKHSSRTNIPKVNKSQLLSFECALPPVELQTQFAQKVQKIEQQKELMQQSLTKMENNFNSLMQRAFKGEF